MGNQVKNGRNYKNNIIKLSLNSFSTNSAIQDNISSYNNKKIKYIKSPNKLNEKYFSKIFPFENIGKNIKNNQLNKTNINSLNKESINNSKNTIISQKNNIIFLSSYSLKTRKLKKKNNINIKIDKNNKTNINNKFVHNELDSKINSTKNQNNLKNITKENYKKSKDLKKDSLYDTQNILNKKKNNEINKKNNKLLDMMEIDSINYNKDNKDNMDNKDNIDNKSSINSSKFINFDIINEKISLLDGLDLTNNNSNNINHQVNKENLSNNNSRENYFEIEFEDYIKKLNLEDVNIDKELFERPLFYHRNKNIKQHKNTKKIKNNYDKKFQSNIIRNKNLHCLKMNKIKNLSLRNSLNNNNKLNNILYGEKTKYNLHKKYYQLKVQNKEQYIFKSNDKNKNINNNSRTVLDFKAKKDISTSPNYNIKLFYIKKNYNKINMKENSSILKQKNNLKNKENIYKDYSNFKKIIKDNFNNINKLQLTDFLFPSKEKNINIKSERNFYTSNVSLKRHNSSLTSRYKYYNKHGDNGIFNNFLKSIYRSANISKNKNIYSTGNSYEFNTCSNNIIEDEIKKKNYKIIRIFQNNNFINSSFIKNKNKKLYNNSPKNKIKLKSKIFINKRSSSSSNIFNKENNYQTNNSNKINKIKNIEIKLMLNSNNNTINNKNKSPIFDRKNVRKKRIIKSYINIEESSNIPNNNKIYFRKQNPKSNKIIFNTYDIKFDDKKNQIKNIRYKNNCHQNQNNYFYSNTANFMNIYKK